MATSTVGLEFSPSLNSERLLPLIVPPSESPSERLGMLGTRALDPRVKQRTRSMLPHAYHTRCSPSFRSIFERRPLSVILYLSLARPVSSIVHAWKARHQALDGGSTYPPPGSIADSLCLSSFIPECDRSRAFQTDMGRVNGTLTYLIC